VTCGRDKQTVGDRRDTTLWVRSSENFEPSLLSPGALFTPISLEYGVSLIFHGKKRKMVNPIHEAAMRIVITCCLC